MIRVKVSGRHGEVSDDLKSYATDKAAKLQRYYDRVHNVEVVFDIEALQHRCEVIAKADHHVIFVAREERADQFASLDAAVRDLEQQLRRHKEKFRNRKHSARRGERGPLAGSAPEDTSAGTQTEGEA